MDKDKGKEAVGLSEIGLGLEGLIRRGARRVIQEAIEVEPAELLEQFSNVKTLSGQRAVARNSYLPEREVLTAAGPIAVKVPKVRAAGECGAAVAVSERDLHRRHERGAVGAAW